MYCRKCGTEISSSAKFCPVCGAKVEINNGSKPTFRMNKTTSIIIAAVVVVALCVGVFLFVSPGKTYTECIQDGKQYLKNEDYKAAKNQFLKAKNKDKENPEAYSYLYVVYEKLGEEENAQDIDTTAQESLSSSDKVAYVNTVKTIIEDNNIEGVQPVGKISSYEVIDENVDDFEISPIDVNNAYYIVKHDNKFYSIDENNNQIVGDLQKVTFIPSGENNLAVWGYKEDGTSVDASGNGGMTSGLGGTSGGYYYLDGNDVKLHSYDGTNTPVNNSILGSSLLTVRKGINNSNTDFEDYLKQDYYIYSPSNSTLYGPYEGKEAASFVSYSRLNSVGLASDNLSGISVYQIVNNEYIIGLFYEKTDDGYVVYNKDASKKSDTIYESAEPISNNAMKVTLNGKMGVLDENLNLVLYGDFEDVSNPINNQCYVKQDGKWKLIQLKEEETDESSGQKGKSSEQTNSSSKIGLSDVNVGDVIEFGSYNGEQLQWDVVGTDGSTLTLFCQTGVKEIQYCDSNQAVTWANSKVHSWLNNEFYSAAFSDDEKATMQKSTIGDYVILPDYKFITSQYDYSTTWYDTNAVAKNGVSYWLMGDYTTEEFSKYQGGMVTSEGFLTHTVGTDPQVDATGIYARPIIYLKIN